MAHPSDQLGTALNLNRTCATLHTPSTLQTSAGLVYGSKSPQIVDMTTGFGRRRKRGPRFGGLYHQMGPASEIGNQYLINKNTGKQLYSGAQQFEGPRPSYINNKEIYIGQVKTPYNPLKGSKSFPEFGKKKVKPRKVTVKVTVKRRRN
jgi:hypothetical protein